MFFGRIRIGSPYVSHSRQQQLDIAWLIALLIVGVSGGYRTEPCWQTGRVREQTGPREEIEYRGVVI